MTTAQCRFNEKRPQNNYCYFSDGPGKEFVKPVLRTVKSKEEISRGKLNEELRKDGEEAEKKKEADDGGLSGLLGGLGFS